MISDILNVSIELIIIFVLVIIYILPVIASWCLFKKAEIPGWKALIPIYNLCLIFNMCGMSEWCAVPILLSSIANIVAKSEQIAPDWLTIIGSIVMLLAFIINIIKAIKLGKSFGKGIGFKIGLVLLPDIFQIILGLDSSKYVGPFVS